MSGVNQTLKMVREARGLSQEALADALGETQGTVSRHEAGRVSLVKLQDWAEVLDHEVVVVPTEQSALLTAVTLSIRDMDEAQVEALTQLVSKFAAAPAWAKATVLEVLKNSTPDVVSKGA